MGIKLGINIAIIAGSMVIGGAALASPVSAPQAANKTAAATATEEAAAAPKVTANQVGAANDGASSSGGAFFVPPVETNEGQRTAQDKAFASTEVPEPGMIGLFGAGLIGLAYARMRRRKLED